MEFCGYLVDVFFLWMKIIKTAFKLDHQEKQEAGGDTDRQAQGIDDCIAFIALQIPEGCLDIVFKHTGMFPVFRSMPVPVRECPWIESFHGGREINCSEPDTICTEMERPSVAGGQPFQ